MTSWMIYGANGYTGELIAREAVVAGERPVLAGRSAESVARLAGELGLEYRIFGLDDQARLRDGLRGMHAVLHCAGPFSRTSAPMVRACLAQRVHYLDITGEIAVLEAIFALDEEAREAGVALVPGVGFDVVPTDCLAAMLAERLPEASTLTLAFSVRGGGMSRGTLRTAMEGLGKPGAARRGGKIVPVPMFREVRDIEFASGRRTATMIPWGDVSTAWRTTGIPDISVYSAVSMRRIRRMRLLSPLGRLVRLPLVGLVLDRLAARRKGPDPESRRKGWVDLWGHVRAPDGREASLALRTPEGYRFTSMAALAAVQRLGRSADPGGGAFTPALIFGSSFVLEIPGVELVEPLDSAPPG